MRAVRFRETGGPEVLVYEEVADPSPEAGAALIPVPPGVSAVLQVETVLPLWRAIEAQRLLDGRETTGKVVLQPWVDA